MARGAHRSQLDKTMLGEPGGTGVACCFADTQCGLMLLNLTWLFKTLTGDFYITLTVTSHRHMNIFILF
jgi:hypothetical protein